MTQVWATTRQFLKLALLTLARAHLLTDKLCLSFILRQWLLHWSLCVNRLLLLWSLVLAVNNWCFSIQINGWWTLILMLLSQVLVCERLETKSHFISRLSLIIRVNVVLNRTPVDSDWHFDNLYGSHLQSQSELYHVRWWFFTLVIDPIGQLSRHIIGRLSVKPWCYWLWRLAMS